MGAEVQIILSESRLRATECRVLLLEWMLGRREAVAPILLEQAFSAFDRVTIYRTLNTFVERNILHRIADAGGATKYALSRRAEPHPHFTCTECETTICIEGQPIPSVPLPDGFVFGAQSLSVQGVCPQCNQP